MMRAPINWLVRTDENNGMPTLFTYKAQNAKEIIGHFARGVPVANFVNTIMAKPLGDAPAFCVLLFGSDNRYTADDVSKRWSFVS